MKRNILFVGILSLALAFAGCTPTSSPNTETAATSPSSEAITTDSQYFSQRDYEIGYDEETCAHITFTESGAEADSNAVSIQDGTVSITAEGTYLLTGTLDSGMVIVNVSEAEKVQLVLDNVCITSPTSAAIYIPSADKVFITTAADSVNVLKNGGAYEAIDDNNIDGVIFSKSDLTLNGAGTLEIAADTGHGVVTKDDLTITSGNYVVSVAGHGLSGKDSVAIAGGTFNLTTGKDGIHSENEENPEKGYVYLVNGSYTMVCSGDGVSAGSFLQVDGGTYDIVTGGGSANGKSHTNAPTFQQQPGGGMQRPGTADGSQTEQPPEGESATPPEMPEQGDGKTPPEGMETPENNGGMTPPEGMETPDGTAPSAPMEGTGQPDIPSDENTQTTSDTPSTKGFKAGTTLTVSGGTFTLDCADDGLHSNGNLTMLSGTAKISTGGKALHADGDLQIDNGTIQVDTCYEGLEGKTVTINDGTIDITATDDGVNAACDNAAKEEMCIAITGGALSIDAGGDGLDSNGDVEISGGTIVIASASQGADASLDYDGTATITGGILLGIGTDSMAQNFGDTSGQGSILLSVGAQNSGTTVSVSDDSGTVLASWQTTKSYCAVLISIPELTQGETYTVTAGDSQTQVTLDSLIYGTGTIQPGQIGGAGGRPGGMGQGGPGGK